MLIALGGLPGVGKTTAARRVAGGLRAAHLRIDAFEVALATAGLLAPGADTGPAGYVVALAAADTCLAAGNDVVVDGVFPIAASREPWTGLAARHGTPIHWFRLVCTDRDEHRRRVEMRTADLPGHVLPGWAAVEGRVIDDWAEPHVVVDTAGEDAADVIRRRCG